MKNLFKNLMLVAVAAMAFTACTETNDEVNAIVEKTVLKFVAGFDEDTRSGFNGETGENEDGKTTYKSSWDGDEYLKVCANGAFASAQEVKLEDAEGHFTVVFEGTVPTLIDVYSPASAWNSEHYPTVPAVQTPRANSVDPAAHMLMAQAVPVESGVVTMSHKFAYGKMTVNTPAEFTISKVELSLVGLPYGWTEDQTYSYTINATNVVNNTFWFTTEALNHVKEFTVKAYDANDNVYAKTVTGLIEGKLAFNVGAVSTFSVSNLVEYVEPEPEPEPEGLVYTAAEKIHEYSTNDIMVSFTGDGLEEMQINFYGAAMVNGSLNVGTFTIGNGLYDGYCFYGDTQLDTITIVSAFENGVYNLVFSNLKDNNGNAVVDGDITFTGLISGLTPVDLRTKLATPNVTWSVEGKTITLSWGAVEGAKEYYVFCYKGGLDTLTTTETTVTFDAEYSTSYDFLVRAVADENDAKYRDSDDFYIEGKITTGKDPDMWADVIATDIQWDSSNSCFTLTAPGFDYINLEVNSANRPNNNSLVVGDYTYGKNENQFRISYNNGGRWNYGDSSGTMNVSFADGQYTIIINVTSTYGTAFKGSIGYKGMPEGWVAPTGGESGGDEPVNPEPDPEQPEQGGGNELGSESNPYTFSSVAVNNFFLNFEGAENGASLQLDRQNSDVNVMSNYGGPFALNYTAIIYGGSGNVYNVGGNTYYYASFAPYSTLEVTKADGNWTCKLKMSVDGGATFTYYTYTGQIANQAY